MNLNLKCVFQAIFKYLSLNDIFFLLQVLVDGPETNVSRQAYRLKNLQLTKFALKFPYHAPTRIVRKAWRAADIKTKWENSSWAQKSKDVKKVNK